MMFLTKLFKISKKIKNNKNYNHQQYLDPHARINDRKIDLKFRIIKNPRGLIGPYAMLHFHHLEILKVDCGLNNVE